ncbi:hypothetical protein [Rubritalea tangerina]
MLSCVGIEESILIVVSLILSIAGEFCFKNGEIKANSPIGLLK